MANVSTARHSATGAARSQSSVDGLVGRVFNNRFRIQSLLARGGMGKVYRAVQLPLGRTVALKVLNPAYTAEQSADFHRRFFLEAAVAARLNHPHTVTVYDFGRTDDDIYYIAMEYLEGVSLRTALGRAHAFAPRRALHVALQISQALREAHAQGAAHRDLKPANVLLLHRDNQADFVKVLDFGLVKHVALSDDHITQPGKLLGSPGYMAPEQIRGHATDTRCDVYALGVLIFEMLTGQPPFVRSNAIETMMAHVYDPVPGLRSVHSGLRVPQALEDCVVRCLAKNPNERYRSMDEVIEVLQTLLGDTSTISTAVRQVRSMPVRLEDEEASGWAVVSSTGILAVPRSVVRRAEAEDEAPTLCMQTPPESPPAPTPPPPASLVHSPRRWAAALGLSLMGLVGACMWLGLPRIPAAASGVTFKLHTDPPGAAVYWGSTQLCEHTPCQVRWDGDEAVPGRSVSLRFVLEGYDEYVASRVLGGGVLSVRSTLTRSRPTALDDGGQASGR